MSPTDPHVSEAARTLAAARNRHGEPWHEGPDLLDLLADRFADAADAIRSPDAEPLPRRVPPLPPVSPERAVDGETYDVGEDYVRLSRQQLAVYEALTTSPGWWTLRELADAVGASETSVSARLRDLRKPKHGGHTVERKRLEGGLYAYRLLVNAERVSA